MKVYEKPVLNALSLSGNDALCACQYDVVGENADETIKWLLEGSQYVDANGNPLPGTFTEEANCSIDVPFEGYCKFTPTGSIIFNS